MKSGDFAAAFGYAINEDHAPASAWSVLGPWQQGLLIFLAIGIVFSALSIVFVQHIHRQQLRQIHFHIGWQDKLDHQWVQLLVEKSALASLDRVETLARDQLGMVKPDLSQVTYLEVEQYDDPWRFAQNTDANDGGSSRLLSQVNHGRVGAGFPSPNLAKSRPDSVAPES